MIYTSKDECYKDILISLTQGILEVEDLNDLRRFYEEIEHYECCQGIAEAFIDYEKIKQSIYDYNGDKEQS